MEESKWIKQISKDNSIQFLLCEHFINPTINDCVVVGNSSFRLLILQSNQIKEVARYDHQRPITSACIIRNEENPEIAFLSGQNLYFMKPSIDHFTISNPISLNYKYSSITSNSTLICLYPRDSSILFYRRSNNSFTNYELPENTKLWSCAFLNDYLVTLEYQNIFKVKMYRTDNLDMIRNVAAFVVNYFTPYKLVSVPEHKSVYLLCESTLIQFKFTENRKSTSTLNTGDWTLLKFPINISDTDPLLIDATPCGVRLFVITAGGIIMLFDGNKLEKAGEVAGATCISTMAISRYLISVESCRVKLFDADMSPMGEISKANCISSSYTSGNFTVASQFSIHSIFYDYGIEVDKCAAVECDTFPIMKVFKDCCFLLFTNKTVVIDSEFKDVTPSVIKKSTFERVHANNRNSFFACTTDRIFVYEYGSFSSYEEASSLSDHKLNSIITADNRLLTSYLYIHSALRKTGTVTLPCAIASILYGDMIYVSLFDGAVLIMDDELNEVKSIHLDFIVFSMVYCESKGIVFGTGDGRVAVTDFQLNDVKIKKETVGTSTVHLDCVGSEVTCLCDNRYFYLGEKEVKKLPPDFVFFGAFTSHSIFLGLLKKSKKSDSHHLIQIHFTDKSLGFRSKLLYEFSQPITKLCSARKGSDFVCCIKENNLLWSRGDVKYLLPSDEHVRSITEWKANHKGKIVQLWMICTLLPKNESRLLIFSQSQSTNKVQPIFQKPFKSPITAFSVSNSSLAFFVINDVINGISLETGALKDKAKIAAKVTDVVALDSTDKYVAALADKNEFSLFSIVSESELKGIAAVRKLGIYGRIKLIGDFLLVSSRVNPCLYVYEIATQDADQKLRVVREVNFLSPVTSIFGASGNAIVNCICGEIYIMSCRKDGEITDLDVSKLFSFSSTAFSFSE